MFSTNRLSRSLLPAAILFGLVIIAGCKSQPVCPPGTTQMGEGPPDGSELWCQKMVEGKVVKEGPFTLFFPSGSTMLEGMYKDGKQDGDWTTWYDNGQRSAVDHYEDGVQQGKHLGWYPSGTKSAEGQYLHGLKSGKWKRWDESGLRNWEEIYKDGKKLSS